MPKRVVPLTDKEIKAAKPGLYADGGGLYLQVIPSGGKSWIFRYQVKVGDRRIRREMGLGSLDKLPAPEARKEAARLRELAHAGVDVIQQRDEQAAAEAAQKAAEEQAQARAAVTFADCAAEYIKTHAPGWRNPKHRAQWSATLEQYAFPFIGDKPVGEVTRADVLAVLTTQTTFDTDPPTEGTLWELKTETATRVRGRIEKVLDYAKVKELRDGENPALWRNALSALLPAPGKVKKVVHHPALPYAQMPAFMKALKAMPGMGARALEFAILTAARSGEVRGTQWSEVDLDRGIWIVPAKRMKANREHHVILSDDAIKLLKALPRIDDNPLVFPAPRGGALSDMALSQVVRRMNGLGQPAEPMVKWTDDSGAEVVPHGFRSTFRDWAGEVSHHQREVIEHAMAHRIPDKAEAAYARGTMLEKRRRLMADWARWCGRDPDSKVIPLSRAVA